MTSDVQITTGRAPGPHVVISTGGPLRTSVGAVKKGSADDRALAPPSSRVGGKRIKTPSDG